MKTLLTWIFTILLITKAAFAAETNKIEGAFGVKFGDVIPKSKLDLSERTRGLVERNFLPADASMDVYSIVGSGHHFQALSKRDFMEFDIFAVSVTESSRKVATVFAYKYNTPTNDVAKILAAMTEKYGAPKNQRVKFGVYEDVRTYRFSSGNRAIFLIGSVKRETHTTILYTDEELLKLYKQEKDAAEDARKAAEDKRKQVNKDDI